MVSGSLLSTKKIEIPKEQSKKSASTSSGRHKNSNKSASASSGEDGNTKEGIGNLSQEELDYLASKGFVPHETTCIITCVECQHCYMQAE